MVDRGANGWLFPQPRLTATDTQYLRTYRYRGEDRGLLNRFVLGVCYDWVVARLPGWLAPNTVTLLGPVLTLCVALCAALGVQQRVLLNVAAACGVWVFLIADNCDGKHARRINCCSPLGDWLDHSLDIVSYCSIMLVLSAALGAGSVLTFFLVAMTLVTYELVCWEALLIGEMIIHEVEACSEGMVIASIIHLVAAFWDPALWLRNPIRLLFGLRPIDVTVLLGIFICLNSVISVARVLAKLGRSRAFSALIVLVPMFVTVGSSIGFWIVFPAAVAEHPWAHWMHLSTSSIFWIFLTNLCRLLGWPLGPQEVVSRPYHFVAAALPWAMLPVTGWNAGRALSLGSWLCTLGLVMWWTLTTTALKQAIGTALFSVKRVKLS